MTDTTSSSNTTSTSDSTSSNSDSLSSVATAQLGGGKKKNGHKMSCGCPICINMKHAKHGGSSCSTNSGHGVSQKDCSSKTGGKKGKRKGKGNGHKPSCGCPICKNMKKKHGGDPVKPTAPFVDLEKGPDDFEDLEMGVGKEVSAADDEYIAVDMATNADLDEAEKGDAGVNIKVGGTRRRNRRGSRKTKRAKKTHRKSRKGKRTHRRH